MSFIESLKHKSVAILFFIGVLVFGLGFLVSLITINIIVIVLFLILTFICVVGLRYYDKKSGV